MNNSFPIHISAIAAALSLFAITSTAAAERLPRPLGAGEQPLSAGVHVLDLVSREQGRPGYKHLPRIAITLPTGWFNYNGWGLNNGAALGVSFWDVDKVYPTGCRWHAKPKIDPGRTVKGLARVLATRPLRHASRPRNVELAGFRGEYLRWSVPSEIDFSRCGQGYFESWTGRGWATDRWQQGPGQVDRLWILDANGKRLVIDANYLPSATRKQRVELNRIVHSIKFLSGSSRTSPSAASGSEADARNGRWIAYSTAPLGRVNKIDDGCYAPPSPCGSDVFVTRVDGAGRPQLVAGRHRGRVWSLCPDFSPNGRLLAFARVRASRDTIVVVRVGRHGPLGPGRRVLKVPDGPGHCPRWSSNSARLAYLVGQRVVVRGLDGSRRPWSTGDPTIHDFDRDLPELLSPAGDLVASLSSAGIIVSQPDGSDRRVIPDDGSYAIAEWSPDRRKLLVMRDVGGGFSMRAVSVVPPFTSKTIVAFVRVNTARSWPRYGDVSWQPRPRR
jgi:hypothetical protein